jgi:hypothetical protein
MINPPSKGGSLSFFSPAVQTKRIPTEAGKAFRKPSFFSAQRLRINYAGILNCSRRSFESFKGRHF